MNPRPITRRRFGGGLLALGGAAVAGCLGDGGDQGDGSTDTVDPALRLDGTVLSSAHPVELVEPGAEVENHATGDDMIANLHWHGDETTHWHRAPLEVPRGDARTVWVRFVDADYETVPVGAGEPYEIDTTLTDASPEGFLEFEQDGDLAEFSGESTGRGELVFALVRDGEVAWEAPAIEVTVGDPDEADALAR